MLLLRIMVWFMDVIRVIRLSYFVDREGPDVVLLQEVVAESHDLILDLLSSKYKIVGLSDEYDDDNESGDDEEETNDDSDHDDTDTDDDDDDTDEEDTRQGYFCIILLLRQTTEYANRQVVPFPTTRMMRSLLTVKVTYMLHLPPMMSFLLEKVRGFCPKELQNLLAFTY